MASAPETTRRVLRLQIVTLAWMSVEAAVSLAAAWQARSVALAAFGGDSVVEWASAAVVFGRFRYGRVLHERVAARVAGGLLLSLAALIVLASILGLRGSLESRPSEVGIVLLLLAVIVMPWLARQKRGLATRTGSAALKADATQSALCGYLAWIALGGLVVNAWWKLPRADSIAALVLVPLIVREGWSAIRDATLCHNCC